MGLLALLALAAWLLFRSGSQPGEAEALLADPSAATTAAGDLVAADSAADPSLIARSAAETGSLAGSTRTGDFPQRETFVLRAIRDTDQSPVPAAELWLVYSDGLDQEAWDEEVARDGDMDRASARVGLRARTDAEGRADLPKPDRWLYVIARAGDLYGEQFYMPDRDGAEATIVLYPDLTLLARLVDQQDHALPAASLVLMQESENWSWVAQRCTTDAEGHAAFRHVQMRLHEGGTARTVLAPGFPLADPPRVEIRRREFPEGEQVLRVAATGSVRIEVFDVDGRPFTKPADVKLQRFWKDRPTYYPTAEFYERAELGLMQAETADGVALFPYVGLGLDLEAGARFDDTWMHDQAHFSGPASAGEQIRARIQQRVLRPTLVMRPVLPDGSALADADLELFDRTVQENSVWRHKQSHQTDQEGVLRHTLGEQDFDGEVRRFLDVEYQALDGDERFGASISLDREWAPGENQLGDLRLARMQILAAGRIEDEQGAPVAFAQIRINDWKMWRGQEAQGWWQVDWTLDTTSASDGRFVVWSPLREGRQQLVVTHRSHLQVRQPVRPGAEDHRLVMQRGWFVKGQILCDAEISADDLRCEFRCDDGGEQSEVLDPSGAAPFRFELGPLGPVVGTITIRDEDTQEELLSIGGVLPHGSDDSRDPRLDPLDLRGALSTIRLSLEGDAGLPVREAEIGVRNEEGEIEEWRPIERNRASFVTRRSALTMIVRASGYAEQEVELKPGENRILLRSRPRLLLRLADPGVAANRHLTVLLAEEGADESWDGNWDAHFGEDGILHTFAPKAGQFVLTPLLLHEYEENSYMPLTLSEAAMTVELLDLAGEQEIVIHLTAAQVEEAIRRDLEAGESDDDER
jgi:hypothetical protein